MFQELPATKACSNGPPFPPEPQTQDDYEKQTIALQAYRTIPLVVPTAKSRHDLPRGSYLRHVQDPAGLQQTGHPGATHVIYAVERNLEEAGPPGIFLEQSESEVSKDENALMFHGQHSSLRNAYCPQAVTETMAGQVGAQTLPNSLIATFAEIRKLQVELTNCTMSLDVDSSNKINSTIEELSSKVQRLGEEILHVLTSNEMAKKFVGLEEKIESLNRDQSLKDAQLTGLQNIFDSNVKHCKELEKKVLQLNIEKRHLELELESFRKCGEDRSLEMGTVKKVITNECLRQKRKKATACNEMDSLPQTLNSRKPLSLLQANSPRSVLNSEAQKKEQPRASKRLCPIVM